MNKWPFKVSEHITKDSEEFKLLKEHVEEVHGWIPWERSFMFMEWGHNKDHERGGQDHEH